MGTLVFDLYMSQPVGDVKFHGGGEYIKTVFRYLMERYDKSYEIIACYNKANFIDDWIIKLIEDNNIKVSHVTSIDEIVECVNTQPTNEVVKFFAGLPYAYKNAKFNDNVITIGTFHGLRGIEKQNDKYAIKYLSKRDGIKGILEIVLGKTAWKRHYATYQKALSKFKIIITDSNHSKYAIKVYYPQTDAFDNINVLYPMTEKGASPDSIEINPNAGSYIMLISANRWIKNSYRALCALSDLYEKGYISGIQTRVYGHFPDRLRSRFKGVFMFFDYVSNEELDCAYKECRLFLYPTLNEGFGNVPMEAMKYGKTCAISAVSSLIEVYGNSAYFFNPYDIKEIENRILQALDNPIEVTTIKQRIATIQERMDSDMDSLCELLTAK